VVRYKKDVVDLIYTPCSTNSHLHAPYISSFIYLFSIFSLSLSYLFSHALGDCFRIFCFLAPFVTQIYVWTPRNFICTFGPDARRHRLWRRGNTARRHNLWRRALTWQQRLLASRADLAPTWWRRGLVARHHRSWRRATNAYKNARAAGQEQRISSHFQTSSKFAGFKDLSWFTS
jgi:hypothetical protein